MKSKHRLAAILSLALLVVAPATAHAQNEKAQKADEVQRPARVVKSGERPAPDIAPPARADAPQTVLQNRSEQTGEDADAEIPYYNNFMSSYKLGPEDIISVTVFDLPKWSRAG